MYNPERPEYRYHSETFGPPEQSGYKELIERFTADKLDADEWAELFAASGARFAGPVAEHHYGFSMWDSTINSWNSASEGTEPGRHRRAGGGNSRPRDEVRRHLPSRPELVHVGWSRWVGQFEG